MPTAAEDAAIAAGIAQDHDRVEITAFDMARMQPLRRPGRPKAESPKVPVTMRVDADVRRTQRFILDAPMPLTLKPGYRVLARAAWNSLPPWALTMLDSSPRLATVDRALADASLRMLRFALVASPARLAGEQRLAG